MGKSLRSKVKKTYRGLKRQVLEPAAASRTLHLASALYDTAGLPLPDPAETGTGSGTGGNRAAWTHGGFVPITCFVPTPPAVRLNRVHGPLAEAELTAAAERQTTPPRSDYVGEREEPVVTAKDLPLQRPAGGGCLAVSAPCPASPRRWQWWRPRRRGAKRRARHRQRVPLPRTGRLWWGRWR